MTERPPPGSSLEPPPPMSTTSLPMGARSSHPKMAVKPPVLASDILREELAPRAPARGMIRVWLGTFSAACALSAVAAAFGFGPHMENVMGGSIAAAVLAAMGAVVPLPYAARATFAALAGLSLLVLGVVDRGPLAPLGHEGLARAAAALVLVAALPASLLFRAQFRASREARVILTAALGVAVPAVVLVVLDAVDARTPLAVRIADGLFAGAALTGFFGYMGAETSAGCGRFAALILVVYGLRLAVQTLPPSLGALVDGPIATNLPEGYGRWGFLVGAAGALAAATLVAFGLFQVLAALFAERARAIDVHRTAATSLSDADEDHED